MLLLILIRQGVLDEDRRAERGGGDVDSGEGVDENFKGVHLVVVLDGGEGGGFGNELVEPEKLGSGLSLCITFVVYRVKKKIFAECKACPSLLGA
ncbi:hypothetical protein ACTL6P_21525 [Endozoicomonas acroporae]|uniref:hypothetical protein n=1 Tax=Endozoicomonas acroporae TaxID=1701104 RepID=UPI003F89F6FE